MILAGSFGPVDGGILGAVVVLLSLSGVFSLAETGLVRTSRSRARSLSEQKRHGARSLVRLVEDPEHFLAPVLLLVLICQLVSASLISIVADRLFGALGVVVALVAEVVVIFVAAEAVPKQWAVRNADRAALFVAPIVSAIIAFPPIRLVSSTLILLSHLLTPKSSSSESNEVTESDLLALADVAAEEDVIEEEERALISSIISFGDTIVREVMSPRTDIVALDRTTRIGPAFEKAMAAGLSRIPTFRRTIDDITGICYARDLIRALRDGEEDLPVSSLERPAHYVPETKRVAPLLREMQAGQFHLAVVIDEYGGTAGIVTLEDLIEELVGDITDEFDVAEPLVEPLGDGTVRVSGKMAVDEVNELVDVDLPVGDSDTIGGLLLHLKGSVPGEGETFEVDGCRLVAEKVARHRVGTVRVLPLSTARPDESLVLPKEAR